MSKQRQYYDHPSAWTVSGFAGKEAICGVLTEEYVNAFDRALQWAEGKTIDVEALSLRHLNLADLDSQKNLPAHSPGRGYAGNRAPSPEHGYKLRWLIIRETHGSRIGLATILPDSGFNPLPPD